MEALVPPAMGALLPAVWVAGAGVFAVVFWIAAIPARRWIQRRKAAKAYAAFVAVHGPSDLEAARRFVLLVTGEEIAAPGPEKPRT